MIRDMKVSMQEGIRVNTAKIALLMLYNKGFENCYDVICYVTSCGSSGDGDQKVLLGRGPAHNKHDSKMLLTVGIFCRPMHTHLFIWKFFAVL